MKINWRVRARNPHFWAQVVASFFVPVLAYYGMSAEEITTWGTLGGLIADAFSNPYVLMLVAVSLYNSVIDPTVSGVSDSLQALRYEKPKVERKERRSR